MFEVNYNGAEYKCELKVLNQMESSEVKAWLLACEQIIVDRFNLRSPAELERIRKERMANEN